MHRLEVDNEYGKYTIDINHYKFIYGEDNDYKFSIYNTIRNYFAKIHNSEYATQTSKRRTIKFDESFVDLKLWKFIDINPFFDIESDVKLGSKSLLLKYILALSEELEKTELFNTLSILVDSLNKEFLNDKEIELNKSKISIRLNDLVSTTLLKDSTALIDFDGYDGNISDLNYEEIMLFQLKVASKIASLDSLHNYLIFINLPYPTKKIIENIKLLSFENLFLIVSSEKRISSELTNIMIVKDSKFIDFANEENINDIIMDLPMHIEKNKFLERCKNINESKKLNFDDTLTKEIFL